METIQLVEEVVNITVDNSEGEPLLIVDPETVVEILEIVEYVTVEIVGDGTTVRLVADVDVSALKVVCSLPNGNAGIASKDNVPNAEVVGVCTIGALTGETLTARTSGVLEDVSFSFTPGALVYLGTNGTLTQSPTLGSGEFLFCIGTALTSTKLNVDLQFILEG